MAHILEVDMEAAKVEGLMRAAAMQAMARAAAEADLEQLFPTDWAQTMGAGSAERNGEHCVAVVAELDLEQLCTMTVMSAGRVSKEVAVSCVAPEEEGTLWGNQHSIPLDQESTGKGQALSFFGQGGFWWEKSSTSQDYTVAEMDLDQLSTIDWAQVMGGGKFSEEVAVSCGTPAVECAVWGDPHSTPFSQAGTGKGRAPEVECAVWGDPHSTPFGQAGTGKDQALSFFGKGGSWSVKSSTSQNCTVAEMDLEQPYTIDSAQVMSGSSFSMEVAVSCGTPEEECTLRGDPHGITFGQAGTDKNQALSSFGKGGFWGVKCSTLQIQDQRITSVDLAGTAKSQAPSFCGKGGSGVAEMCGLLGGQGLPVRLQGPVSLSRHLGLGLAGG